jgi:hypothetical protein
MAAVLESGTRPSVTLAQLIRRFAAILLSGKTEQQLSADEQAQYEQLAPHHAPVWEVPAVTASGTAGAGLTTGLLIRRKRRRLAMARGVLT